MTMAVPSSAPAVNASSGSSAERKFSGKEKPMEVRMSNITAGKGNILYHMSVTVLIRA